MITTRHWRIRNHVGVISYTYPFINIRGAHTCHGAIGISTSLTSIGGCSGIGIVTISIKNNIRVCRWRVVERGRRCHGSTCDGSRIIFKFKSIKRSVISVTKSYFKWHIKWFGCERLYVWRYIYTRRDKGVGWYIRETWRNERTTSPNALQPL